MIRNAVQNRFKLNVTCVHQTASSMLALGDYRVRKHFIVQSVTHLHVDSCLRAPSSSRFSAEKKITIFERLHLYLVFGIDVAKSNIYLRSPRSVVSRVSAEPLPAAARGSGSRTVPGSS